uniref:Uncharacterized protein n=1 Tax=viral metagenome TaxID=1070528 RepID=A0A6C0IIA9_9ZZZZ
MSQANKNNYVLQAVEPTPSGSAYFRALPEKEPKLLTLQTPTIRDQRTLIWRNKNTDDSNKWDGIVTSIEAYDRWTTHGWSTYAPIVGLILIDVEASDVNDFTDRLFAISKEVPLVLLSQKVLSLKSADFWEENFDNVVNLDTIMESYPFLKPWSNTVEDAIHMFAIICRYNRVIGFNEKYAVERPSDIVFEQQAVPQQAWLVTQFYAAKSAERASEIKECLRRNCACPYLDKIVLLNERDYSGVWMNGPEGPIPGSEKIKQVVIGDRLMYADFLRYVNKHVPEGVYAILANADIYFGDSLLELWKINMVDKMLALLRWDQGEDAEPENAIIFGPRADSQDAWIVLSDSAKQRKWDYKPFQFQLGQAGCDNAFAGHMLQQRFCLCNPALTFKTFHLHNSNIRTYDKKDYIRAPIYINLVPTYLIDTRQETIPLTKSVEHLCNQLVTFEVQSSSMSNEITYCTMLEKDGRYKWEPSVENHYFEPAIPVYTWNQPVAVTPNGLVYDLRTIYMGKHADDPMYNYWKGTSADILVPMCKVDTMLAIPFESTAVFDHIDTYITYYLSRVLRLTAMNTTASFWLPPAFAPLLKDFSINLNRAVPFNGQPCWAEKVVGFLPGPCSNELGSEDIACLRSHHEWIMYPLKRVCTVIIDNILTETVAKQLFFPLLMLTGKGWTLRCIKKESEPADFFGSSICITYKSLKAASIWACPKECCLIEFQQELDIRGEIQHLAHVSELKAWVLLLSKGSITDVQEQMAVQLGKWLKKNGGEIVMG